MHYSSLLVVYLEWLNCSPRALISAFSVTTEAAMKDKLTLIFYLYLSQPKSLSFFSPICVEHALYSITALRNSRLN